MLLDFIFNNKKQNLKQNKTKKRKTSLGRDNACLRHVIQKFATSDLWKECLSYLACFPGCSPELSFGLIGAFIFDYQVYITYSSLLVLNNIAGIIISSSDSKGGQGELQTG